VKKVLRIVLTLSLGIFLLFGCAGAKTTEPPPAAEDDEKAVAGLVEEFGRRLQNVSLQAPKDVVGRSMQEHYGGLVSPALLEEWTNDPAGAPGRVTSSPWPERIEILSITKQSDDAYEVRGEVIEVSSASKASGGIDAKRPITLAVGRSDGGWLITAVELGPYESAGAAPGGTSGGGVVYSDSRYGFTLSLPESWKGYSVVTGLWEGTAVGGSQVVETGPLVSIRHPLWTSDKPRQDIPIMVFTLSQWEALQREEYHIGAAPVGPKELGRNSGYVFALPARYNYAFPEGHEEVEEILNGRPLQPNENYAPEICTP